MAFRQMLRAALIGVLALGLGGCTVPVKGVVGITYESSGEYRALVQMCEGYVDSVILYDSPEDVSSDSGVLLDVELPERVDDSGFVSLGWGLLSRLRGRTDVHVYAASHDNTSSALGPSFGTRDLAALRAGEILVSGVEGKPRVVRDLGELEAAAQSWCD